MCIRLSWFYQYSRYTPRYMHIIVDIRTRAPHELLVPKVGIAWASMWQRQRRDDKITLLIYEHQEKLPWFHYVVAPGHYGPWWKKSLKPRTGNEVFRCVSFSTLDVYDTSIPTVRHIWSNAHALYPTLYEGTFMRKWNEWWRKISLKKPTTLIVPDIQIGRELVEIYDIREDSIEIVPHIPLDPYTAGNWFQQPQDLGSYFIYDGGYGEEANLMTLFVAWEKYIHAGWRHQLLLLGMAGETLSSITHMLRSLDIHGSVRYIWALDEASLAHIYRNASWWIYTGAYYGAWPIIEVALAYALPLLLSDIRAFEQYEWIKVHPSHTAEIAQCIKLLEKTESIPHIRHHERTYIEAYEKILMKK